MATNDKRTRLYNRKFTSTSALSTYFYDVLNNDISNLLSRVYPRGVVTGGVISSSTADTITVSATNAFSNDGHLIEISEQADVSFENTSGITYYVGIKYVEVEASNPTTSAVETSSQTSIPEYVYWQEQIGELGNPSLVINNGDGTLTIELDNIVGTTDQTGRTARVWLSTLLSTDTGWYEDLTIAYGTNAGWVGSKNYVTTVSDFHQTSVQGTITTTVTAYRVWMSGITITRIDISSNTDYVYLGTVLGTGSGELPSLRVWTVSNNLNTAAEVMGDAGTQSAGLSFVTTNTEEYDGTSWTVGNNLNTSRWGLAGCGLQTAGLSFGGNGPSAVTEEYDGTTWTAANNMNVARFYLAGCGLLNAGLSFGGTVGGGLPGILATTEKYNGTNWSISGSMNTSRDYLAGAGTQSAGLSFGGTDNTGVDSGVTEEFDGATWTVSGGVLNTVRTFLAGCGTQIAGLSFGGYTSATPAYASATEEYDGTSWLTSSGLNIARAHLGGAGTQSAGLSFGGNTGSTVADTEEYVVSASVTPLTTYGDFNNHIFQMARNVYGDEYAFSGSGVVSTRLPGTFVDADTTPDIGNYEVFLTANTAATEITALDGGVIGDRRTIIAGDSNTTLKHSATLSLAESPSGPDFAMSLYDTVTFKCVDTNTWYEIYRTEINYTNIRHWTNSNGLNTARYSLAGFGVQTAAISCGGVDSIRLANTEEYDGTSWAESNLLNTARFGLAGCGYQIAGLSFGGRTTGIVATTEEYDGTSWASGYNLNTARYQLAGCGTQTAGLSFGGYIGTNSAVTEEYDGISWAASNNLNTARHYLSGCGTQTSSLSFGGWGSSAKTVVTEEYDGTSWTSVNGLNVARYGLSGCGTQTSGLSFGGSNGTETLGFTEEYDGTSWVVTCQLNTARLYLGGAGVQTSGLSFGGYTTSYTAVTEEYSMA